MNDAMSTHKGHIFSAEGLRKRMVDEREAEARRASGAAEEMKARQKAFAADFRQHHIGHEERAHIMALVDRAAEEGEFEVMVYSFPSDLCTDGGRAINNTLPNWPDTLQGKAREIYDLFERVGKPLGYRFKAMVVSFPDGMPGDIGFFVSWKPPIDAHGSRKD